MIVGSLASVSRQIRQTPNIREALAYLQQIAPSSIEDGRYTIVDTKVIAIFQSCLTEELSPAVEVEGHRKYIDIYLMLAGSEQVGWVSIEHLDDLPAFNEEGDFWKKDVRKERLSFVTLHQGDAAVLFPEDAHAAQFAVGAPAPARKVVMKVAV
jgi:YhcH/YjgK/YiaL family protein